MSMDLLKHLAHQRNEESIARGASGRTKTHNVGSGKSMSVPQDIDDLPVTAFNVTAADGTKVAIIVKGGHGYHLSHGEVWWPGQQRIPMTAGAALAFKSEVALYDKRELRKLARKMAHKHMREGRMIGRGVRQAALVEQEILGAASRVTEGRSREAILRGLDVTIDEMETDPDYRSKKPITGRSAKNYIHNLAAHAKEIQPLDAKVARSISVTKGDMQADIDRRGQIDVKPMGYYISNLKADLGRLKKAKTESLNESRSGLNEAIPEVGKKVRIKGEVYKVQDVNPSDFDPEVLLVKLGEGRRVKTYGFDMTGSKWLTPVEVATIRTQTHDLVDDGEEAPSEEAKTEAELFDMFTNIAHERINAPRATTTGFRHRAEESTSKARRLEQRILTEAGIDPGLKGAMKLARLLKRAGTSSAAARDRVIKKYDLSDAAWKSLVRSVWGE